MSSFIFPPGLSLASLFSRHFYGLKLWKEERVSVLFILFSSFVRLLYSLGRMF